VDNANKKGEQTAPKASRTSISEPAGTWYEGPTPQQVRKRYRVQFHETTKVREFKNDESIPARPTSTTQEATPIKDLDPIVKKRDNDSINIAQIEFSRPVLDRATYNRTWKTIFKSKQKQFGFRLLHGENVHYVLVIISVIRIAFMSSLNFFQVFLNNNSDCMLRTISSLIISSHLLRPLLLLHRARRSAKQHQENSCLLCLKISKIASCWYR